MIQNEIAVIGATRIVVGLSQIIRVSPGPYEIAGVIKIIAGGGTLELVEPVLSGSSTAAASGWGTGYPLGSAEAYNFYGPACFYLAATGATMTAALSVGRTSGATVL